MYRLNEENKLIQFDFPNNPDVRDFDIKYEASRDFSFNFLNLLTNKEPIKVNNTGSTTIFNVGDEKILPFESKVVYISKYEEKTYKNFNENKFELKLNNSVFYYILIIVYISFVGLLLYAILYFVVTRAKYLQKLLPHLFHHPRGRGQ